MKKHTMKINCDGLTLEEDGEYFRVWIHLGKDKAHFQSTNIDHAIDIMKRLRKNNGNF